MFSVYAVFSNNMPCWSGRVSWIGIYGIMPQYHNAFILSKAYVLRFMELIWTLQWNKI
jgi:hypothetical protein